MSALISKRDAGFTLVELLVAIVIVAILGIVGMVIFSGVQKSARDASRKADMEAMAKAYETNFSNNGYTELQGTNFADNAVPDDPRGVDYFNVYADDGSGFRVCAALEANPGTICNSPNQTCFCKGSAQGTINQSAGLSGIGSGMGLLPGGGVTTYIASTGYSSTQGANNWRYKYVLIGSYSYTDMAHYLVSAEWSKDSTASPTYTLTWNNGGHPGSAHDSVRTWIASANGSVAITNNGGNIKMFQATSPDGVDVSILVNNSSTPVWSGTVTNQTGIPQPQQNMAVTSGDQIHFRINRRANNTSDSTNWDPQVVLTP